MNLGVSVEYKGKVYEIKAIVSSVRDGERETVYFIGLPEWPIYKSYQVTKDEIKAVKSAKNRKKETEG